MFGILRFILKNIVVGILSFFLAVGLLALLRDVLFPITQKSPTVHFTIYLALLIIFTVVWRKIILALVKIPIKLLYWACIAAFTIITALLFTQIGIGFLSGQLIAYSSCGPEFNELYNTAVESNNPYLCLENNFSVSTFLPVQSYRYCKAPDGQWIRARIERLGCLAPDQGPCEDSRFRFLPSSCIDAVALATEHVEFCNVIVEENLSIDSSVTGAGLVGQPYDCMLNYAYATKDQSICEQIPDFDQISAGKRCMERLTSE